MDQQPHNDDNEMRAPGLTLKGSHGINLTLIGSYAWPYV